MGTLPKTHWKNVVDWDRWSKRVAFLGAELEISPAKRRIATLVVVILALLLLWAFWCHYMLSPWTRDGRVRVEVVNLAAQISGQVIQLPVVDNQQVKKGDLLFVMDPSDYQYALDNANSLVQSRQIEAQNAKSEAVRRAKMEKDSVSLEEVQNYESVAARTQANYEEAVATQKQAVLNLSRTHVVSPVNGFVTNLHLRIGDYATAGQIQLTVVDSDSFWIAGYFEETKLPHIKEGYKATIKLMGVGPEIHGHVDSFARGIADNNSGTDETGLSSVNPIFTWVRLAQRIPVRIAIDEVPKGVVLSAGQTCTVVVKKR